MNNNNGEMKFQNIAQNLSNGKDINIVKIRDLQPGENFSGLVYVRKNNFRRNKHNSNMYDLYFQCVDGDGVTFRAAMFSTENKQSVRNEIMYINKGMAVEQFKTGNIYYNIDNITKFVDFQVPINMFLKEIPDIDKYTIQVMELISELKNEEVLYGLYETLEKKYNYLEMIKTIPYKYELGVRLGSTLRVITDMCNVYKSITTIKTPEEVYEYRLFILVTLLAFAQQSIMLYNDINESGEVNSNFISEMLLPISENIIIMAYQTTLKNIDRAKILSILGNVTLYNRNSSIEYKFPLETMFFSILKLVEKNIEVWEIRQSSDIENKRHSSGMYIV